MKAKQVVSALLVASMAAGLLAGCGGDSGAGSNNAGGTQSSGNDGEIKEFTAFFFLFGSEIKEDN